MLKRIELAPDVLERNVPAEIQSRIEDVRLRIQTFQDRWDRPQIEQFVAADYYHVWQVLTWIKDTQLLIGKRFLEWGSGFAVVSAMADLLGFDTIAIEAEADLLDQGRNTAQDWNSSIELVRGNFLPPGAELLADDPTLPSLGHQVSAAYESIAMDLDDFSIVYAYPWPGEDDFHEAVFDRYAAVGALLVLFCGPNDIRVWRKTK